MPLGTELLMIQYWSHVTCCAAETTDAWHDSAAAAITSTADYLRELVSEPVTAYDFTKHEPPVLNCHK